MRMQHFKNNFGYERILNWHKVGPLGVLSNKIRERQREKKEIHLQN